MSGRLHFHRFEPAGDQAARDLLSESPSSAINRESPPEPELRLMAMILEDAMNCYRRFGTAKSVAARREYDHAERWLFSERNDWIFSCENICSHLGVAASFVRAQLQARRGANQAADENGRDSIVQQTNCASALR